MEISLQNNSNTNNSEKNTNVKSDREKRVLFEHGKFLERFFPSLPDGDLDDLIFYRTEHRKSEK